MISRLLDPNFRVARDPGTISEASGISDSGCRSIMHISQRKYFLWAEQIHLHWLYRLGLASSQ